MFMATDELVAIEGDAQQVCRHLQAVGSSSSSSGSNGSNYARPLAGWCPLTGDSLCFQAECSVLVLHLSQQHAPCSPIGIKRARGCASSAADCLLVLPLLGRTLIQALT
jgi:hypothetical protein